MKLLAIPLVALCLAGCRQKTIGEIRNYVHIRERTTELQLKDGRLFTIWYNPIVGWGDSVELYNSEVMGWTVKRLWR